MKRLCKWGRIATCAVLLLFVLSACRVKSPRTVYSDEYVLVSRLDGKTTVTDTIAGTEYRFTRRRVKRGQYITDRKVSDTDTLSVAIVQGKIVIVEKGDGRTIRIR